MGTIPAKTRVGLLGLKQQHCGCERLTRILHQTADVINDTDMTSVLVWLVGSC